LQFFSRQFRFPKFLLFPLFILTQFIFRGP
jgi:hypothetical protein